MTRDEIWLEAVAKATTETMPEHYAGYKAGYFDAALSRETEIATLRARVAELESMVPKWVKFTEWERNRNLYRGWDMTVHNLDQRNDPSRMVLMVPPIPAPETKS